MNESSTEKGGQERGKGTLTNGEGSESSREEVDVNVDYAGKAFQSLTQKGTRTGSPVYKSAISSQRVNKKKQTVRPSLSVAVDLGEKKSICLVPKGVIKTQSLSNEKLSRRG